MAIAFVQSTNGSGTATGTATTTAFAGSPVVGNIIVVCCGTNSATSNDFASVTDVKGNTYTRVLSDIGTAVSDLEIWYSVLTTGGASFTVTATSGNAFRNVVVVAQEFSGVATTSPLDVSTSSSGSGTAASSGASASTTVANELVFGAALATVATTFTLGAGYTNLGTNAGLAVLRNAAESKVVSSTGTQTATFTLGTTGAWQCAVATFKAAGAAATSSVSTELMMGV